MSWDEKAEDHAVAHHTYEHMTLGENDDGYRMFVKGASWQRDQLRSDEAVERVARELCERTAQIPFEQAPGFIQEAWRGDARAAITALLGEDE